MDALSCIKGRVGIGNMVQVILAMACGYGFPPGAQHPKPELGGAPPDLADGPIIPYPKSPQPTLVTAQHFPQFTGIVGGHTRIQS